MSNQQAFPITGTHEHVLEVGMTLRDYFAAKVIGGLCANSGGPFQSNNQFGWGLVNVTFDQLAEDAYTLADAMLKARQQEPQP